MSALNADQLSGQVAVVTGAGSGLGRELALHCGDLGMRLALADVDEAGLAETVELLGGDVESFTQRVDVSQRDQVDALADATFEAFGGAHLLFNNAGVATAGPLWLSTAADWQWTMGVNVMGVVHGIQAFVPRMIEAGEPGRVVNTASLAGLSSVPGSGVYCASKHAVVTISETLHHEFAAMGIDHLGVSVLCPAFFKTRIAESERNRPDALAETNPMSEQYTAFVKKAIDAGKLSAADIAAATLDAVTGDRFYILPHRGSYKQIEARMRDILDARAPTSPFDIKA